MNEMIQQITNLAKDSKNQYFKKIGNNIANLHNGSKPYYSLINTFLNKVKTIPIPPPPLIENSTFVQVTGKAEIFNTYFI